MRFFPWIALVKFLIFSFFYMQFNGEQSCVDIFFRAKMSQPPRKNSPVRLWPAVGGSERQHETVEFPLIYSPPPSFPVTAFCSAGLQFVGSIVDPFLWRSDDMRAVSTRCHQCCFSVSSSSSSSSRMSGRISVRCSLC